MRVLFVNQYFPPDATNTAYLLGELAEDLSRHHEVWVLAGTPSYNPEASTYQPRGVHLRRARSTAFARASMAGRLANYLTFVLSAARESLRVPRPDVVVALTDPPIVGAVGLLAARRHRAPFVQVYMDVYPDVAEAVGKIGRPWVARLWRRWNRRLRRGADRIVVVGRDMARKLERQEVPAERIAFLPNWAEDVAASPEEVREARRAHGWGERFVIMHAGNAGLAQGLDVVVDAAAGLRDQGHVLFVVLGDGAARAGLERRVDELGLPNVQFLPHLPKDRAASLVAAADAHLISLVPGMWGSAVPSKLYGILAAGKPFVAAVDQGSEVALVAEEHGCGVRVDSGDAEALAAAVRSMADRPDPEMGDRGRQAFAAQYTRERCTSAYRELLKDVAGRTSGTTRGASPAASGASSER
jgi:colanic acid biosynthesis glycosyl transferase WcaI